MPFTRSQLATMSPAEYAANRDAIIEASNKGEIVDDGGKVTQKPVDEIIKEIEANGDKVYQPSGRTYFRTSDIRNMTPAEYEANDIKTAWLEGRVIEDNKPKPLVADPRGSVRITEGGGTPQTPAWMRRVNRDVDAKQAEAAAKVEAEKSIAERYLAGINRGEA